MAQPLQVVLLAGGSGSTMYPLTEQIPKCLLPVANRPLISFQLELLERAGFNEVIIVCQETTAPRIVKCIGDFYKGKISIEYSIFKEYLGTAEILHGIRDRLRNDFIIISGDLVADMTFVHQMVDMHRSKDAALTILLKQSSQETLTIMAQATKTKGTKGFGSQGIDYIGLDGQQSKASGSQQRLLMLQNAADIEDELVLPKALLRHYPSFTIHTTLKDAHFYIISHWVLDLLEPNYRPTKQESLPPLLSLASSTSLLSLSSVLRINSTHSPMKPGFEEGDKSKDKTAYKIKHFKSIKTDLIPFLISCQTSVRKLRALPSSAFSNDQSLAFTMSTTQLITPASPVRGKTGCFVFVIGGEGYCARANTLQSYMEINRDIARNAAAILRPWEKPGKNNYIHESAQIHPMTQIGADCVVGAQSKIGARCGVKKSIIGRHCQIADNVKISNSVIMDRVTIGEGCNITDAIICDDVVLKESCQIKDSQIGVGYYLPAGSNVKDEPLCKEKK
eukprot:TRINITY_DN1883_c0_g1_i1.p1 TRINITY_DN1883_c0_g1~~TRINITY_DN1883_c0_g1_i1.p1  ORF type:complete len:506 (-),score=62.37 TRINITY_DN1883_c0_g1_i1:43-1560(-)